MSTEHNFEEGSAQYKAIKKYLKKVDRTVTPWVIIGGHRYKQLLKILFNTSLLIVYSLQYIHTDQCM